MKKLVIFDLDGTLLNTIADLAHSTNYALNKLGYPTHEIEKYNFMVGNGINKLFERALPEGEKYSVFATSLFPIMIFTMQTIVVPIRVFQRYCLICNPQVFRLP